MRETSHLQEKVVSVGGHRLSRWAGSGVVIVCDGVCYMLAPIRSAKGLQTRNKHW